MARFDALEGEIGDLKQQNEILQQQRTALASQFDDLQNEYTINQLRLLQLEDDNKILGERIASLATSVMQGDQLTDESSQPCDIALDSCAAVKQAKAETSCQNILNANPAALSGIYTLVIDGTKYPTWCEMINGEGWALIIRADGMKSTFAFSSSLWTTGRTINTGDYINGTIGTTEYKSPLFSVYPYSELRLGMRFSYYPTKWLNVKHGQYASMHAAMTEGHLAFTGMTRNDWLTLANNGALQRNCNRMGYNLIANNIASARIRIGILGNDDNDCITPDSFIGFGAKCLLHYH
jgi:hypothetical protein